MGSGKHLIDEQKDLVVTALRGLARVNPRLSIDVGNRLAFIPSSSSEASHTGASTGLSIKEREGSGNGRRRVKILSGGGSGHEPASAGFVGANMLDCAVAGDVFASPSAKQVGAGIAAITTASATTSSGTVSSGSKGEKDQVLVIVLNYTGDRLHFGIAVEAAVRAGQADVDFLVVEDDVAVGRKQGGRVGRRGLAGIVLLQKVCGGYAATGGRQTSTSNDGGGELPALQQVKDLGKVVSDNLVTVGASLDHASVPGAKRSDGDDTLGVEELEVGMGIHNEPGYAKIKLPKSRDLVSLLLRQLLDGTDEDRAFVPFAKGDEVVVLVNNLGGISTLELHAFAQLVHDAAETDYGLRVVRSYTGAFVTSLDGAGASISIVNLSNMTAGQREIVTSCLDLPTDAPGWNGAAGTSAWSSSLRERLVSVAAPERPPPSANLPTDAAFVRECIERGCKAVIAAEPEITRCDTVAGDGDCGTTLKSAAEAVLSALDSCQIALDNLVATVADVAAVLEASMGGTGGALYTIYLSALSTALATGATTRATSAGGKDSSGGERAGVDVPTMAQCLQTALDRLRHYTTAQVGDKTLIDALEPFVTTLMDSSDVRKALSAAKAGAESTKDMAAGLGRATYVDAKEASNVPDAGALGVVALLEGIVDAVR